MDPIAKLADQIFREKIERARAEAPEEKMVDGPRLFDFACEVSKSGIRMQYPDADEAEVHRHLLHRLAIAEQLENRT